MKLLNITIAVALLAVAGSAIPKSKAWMPHGTGGGGGGLVCPANDGTASAPAGVSAQRPTLLSGYTKTIISTLGCNVAGVNYGVGYPAATVLTDWQSIPTQGGEVTVNTTTNIVTFSTSAPSCIVDGVDFSLHNGAILSMNCTNPSVTNSKFLCGSTCIANASAGILNFLSTTGNITVSKNIIDGGSQASNNEATLIFTNSAAITGLTLQYNWLKNGSQQVLELNSPTAMTLTYKYNLIENFGWQTGAHPNYLQFGPGGYTATVQFNTVYQTPQVAAGEGFQFYNGVSGNNAFINIAFQYNTMVSSGANANSYLVHGLCHSAADCGSTLSTVSGTAVGNNNFFDITGALGAFYPSSASAMWTAFTLSSNWNMSTGAAIGNSP